MTDQTSQITQLNHSLQMSSEFAIGFNECNHQMLYEMINAIPGMVYQVKANPDGEKEFVYVSEGVNTLLGLSVDQMMDDYHAFWEHIDPDDRVRLGTEMPAGLKAGKAFFVDFRYKTPGGQSKFLRNHVMSISRRDDGSAINNGIVIDFTEQKQMADELLRSQEQLISITDTVPGILYQVKSKTDGTAELMFVNEKLKEIHGSFADYDEALRLLVNSIHPDDIERVNQERAIAVKDNLPLRIDYRIIDSNKEVRWLRSYSKPSHEDSDGNKYRNAIVVDVAVEKAAEFKIKNQVNTISLIQNITAAANQARKPEDILGEILELICAYSDHQIGHAFLVNQKADPAGLVSSGIWFMQDEERFVEIREITESIDFKAGVGMPGKVWEQKKTLWVDASDVDASNLRGQAGLRIGFKSGFCFPAMVGHDVVAVLEFYTLNDFVYKEEYLDTMAKLGVQIGRVFERKQSEDERTTLSEQLVSASRLAGMAEVASGVLHNVGNVLNSLNVSTGIVTERIRDSSVSKLTKAVEMLNQNSDQLATFLTEDGKGKKLLVYLNSLSEKLLAEQAEVSQELKAIANNVEHVKEIVKQQQSYTSNKQVLVKESINTLMEHALDINTLAMERHNIDVIREYEDIPDCMLDKHNVLQIIVNLITNAKQAMTGTERVLSLRTKLVDNNMIRVEVQDTGSGIAEEDIDNVFQYGFTTKEKGNGFGLHSSANTAKKMGGALNCYSDGPGKGATFVLDVPLVRE